MKLEEDELFLKVSEKQGAFQNPGNLNFRRVSKNKREHLYIFYDFSYHGL